MGKTLVTVDNVTKDYRLPRRHLFRKAPLFRALHGIDLEIGEGTSFGVVGESGCGKSTLARIVMALDEPTQGTVYFGDDDIFKLPSKELRRLRRNFQMVFQDPYGSLNPRRNVLRIVSEPLDTLKENLSTDEKRRRVESTLAEVGLNPTDIDKYPHEFSGGQRQRIAIARALITRPSLIVADESVSALDVSVQAQVLNLMMDLQEKYGLAYMFISHDLSVVEYVTDEIAVIYLGRIVERGKTRDIFQRPLHPYTRMLLEAIPDVNPLNKKARKRKTVPSLENGDDGCPFLPRCGEATDICRRKIPDLAQKGERLAACHNVSADG
ncbi:MAG: ATP-binding cassette domain-containing protein [Proteobacteria bacterium]|nr:ATP-binding cassette domain-containing protein [Pseudomonadota bacterium]